MVAQSVPQTSTVDSLRAEARKQYTYWKYGTSTPSETFIAKLSESLRDTWDWVSEQMGRSSQAAQQVVKNLRQEL